MSDDYRTPETPTLTELEGEEEAHVYRQAVAQQARTLRIRHEANRVVAIERAGSEYPHPTAEDDGLLSDLMIRPRRHEQPRIDGLMGMPHNAVIAAQFKSGKTTLGSNLLRCAADGLPFLGRAVHMGGGRVAWLNGEMDRDDFNDYLAPMGIGHPERIAVRNMRGRRLNLMNDYIADEFIAWLKTHEVEWLWIDSWRVLCSWCGVNENRNDEVDPLTERIDSIKREAGVQTFTALAHTGRAAKDEGTEHARGATALDDWQDSRWVLTKIGGDRFLYVEGRGVELPETRLVFDPDTRLLSLGEGNRQQHRQTVGVDVVVEFVTSNPGCTNGEIRRALEQNGMTQRTSQGQPISAAERSGAIHHLKRGTSKHYYPGPDPDADWQQESARALAFEGEQVR
ncbi:AAA family ATPase [Nocardioides sp. CFH 31398]|uniref:AAA family ATPase n=1 Tax=Nocardioides sp. CFH 31398 TaxID=2919579 RepID=UPI001F068DAF|nr:AAA family ATPase [Nocardioides sp. CFH 31398]MCH1867056.1 AAA family ATPase [Nocardioides sp. CFH 31398]